MGDSEESFIKGFFVILKTSKSWCFSMIAYKWVVPDTLAVSSMPSSGDIEDIVSKFKCLVILAESSKPLYDNKLVVESGLRVLHVPVPDFSAPSVIKLHEIVEFICSCNKPVLVHYSSGKVRSGVVAVAYLMASQGIAYGEALSMARGVDPGFVETSSQPRVLKLYERLLGATSKKLLSKTIEIGERYRFGRGVGHASKVLELSIELVLELERLGILGISLDTERALYVASILHDIGVAVDPGNHKEHSYRLILGHREELNSSCNCNVAEKAAVIARLHGKSYPVPLEMNVEDRAAIGIIRVADGLDHTLTQSIKHVEVVKSDKGLVIGAYCGNSKHLCEINIDRANAKKTILEEALGTEISIVMM